MSEQDSDILLPKEPRSDSHSTYAFAQAVELSPLYPYRQARIPCTVLGQPSHRFFIGWIEVRSGRPPDPRLAVVGNVWIQETSGGGAMSVCTENGVWREWDGTQRCEY